MQNQKEIADNQRAVENELDEKSSNCSRRAVFHRKYSLFTNIGYGIAPGWDTLISRVNSVAPLTFLINVRFRYQLKTMADVANKYAENVDGKFYVDDQCIDCDLCRETAPANFKRNDDGGHSYVYKQPESPEEEALCKEAMEGCPVEAIGNDGA